MLYFLPIFELSIVNIHIVIFVGTEEENFVIELIIVLRKQRFLNLCKVLIDNMLYFETIDMFEFFFSEDDYSRLLFEHKNNDQ